MFLMDSGRFRSAGIKSDMRKIAIRIRPAFKSRTYFSHGTTKIQKFLPRRKSAYTVTRRASARLVNSQNRKSIVNRSHLKAFTGKYAPILLSSPAPRLRDFIEGNRLSDGVSAKGGFSGGRRPEGSSVGGGSESLVKTVFQDKIMSRDTL